MITIYPLRFFNHFPQAEALTKQQPDLVVDATEQPGFAMPACCTCKTGLGMVHEEQDDTGLSRYRCITCNKKTDWIEGRESAAQLWANLNGVAVTDTN